MTSGGGTALRGGNAAVEWAANKAGQAIGKEEARCLVAGAVHPNAM